ncbi:phosphohydrolase [Bacterioplanes sanyensis]|uniref:Phosphohydrolase n=1 Tax=Bacterioplanes sanyensis TaxID=1249553 RepID=A0A222FEK4_9GAMM|nr:transporter substrate-binding domain-containing protein [Bacterioplanes sanyensis]ASP37438.1 phosphohydrolase [Bacterioplanes sanyensis]
MTLRAGIRLTTVSVFFLVTLAVALIAISLQYYFGQRMARDVAQEHYLQASNSVVSQLSNMEKQGANTIRLISQLPALLDSDQELTIRQYFKRVLQQNPAFYGVYIGRDDGYFYELINLETSESARATLNAHPSDRWVEMRVRQVDGERTRQLQYYDSAFNLRWQHSELSDYDPRQRPWYREAQQRQTLYQTEPYLFAQLQAPGMTLSQVLPDQQSVVGIDLLLTTLSDFLQTQGFGTHSGHAYIFQQSGDLIASSQHGPATLSSYLPTLVLTDEEQRWLQQQDTLRVSNELNWPPMDFALEGQPRGYSIDLLHMIAQITGMEMTFVNGLSWEQLVERFQNNELDILHSVFLTDANRHWGLASTAYATLPFALAAKQDGVSLSQLAGRSLAIPAGWSVIPIVQQQFPDIQIRQAESTLEAMQWVQQGLADAALDNAVVLRTLKSSYYLNDIKISNHIGLTVNESLEQLVMLVQPENTQLQRILNKAIAAIPEQHLQTLKSRWLDPYNAHPASSNRVPPAMLEAQAQVSQHALVPLQHNGKPYYAYVRTLENPANSQHRYFGVLVPQAVVDGPFMQQVKISIAISAAILALILPLSWAFAYPIVRPVRELAAENDKIRMHRESHVKHVPSRILELDQLSESIVQMVQTIKQQEQSQRDLLDAFIQLIADAIDQKSPYTGGHCARVPELALLLVKAADDSQDDAFKDFSVEGRDAWRELRIAAWLHDCGKVTTPEYVVDKATKLETIHNRIHEIRTRFEVLWRDAEITRLRQTLANPEQQSLWQQQCDEKQQQLKDDFEFIASCNIGGEYQDDAKQQQRLQQLADTTWQRHFDDRLGLSIAEIKRFAGPAADLPVTEPLLKDGPEHIIEREHDLSYMESLGIQIEAPEYLYNRGELHNLMISRGTLTPEERFKINEHIIATIRMLEALPFPPSWHPFRATPPPTTKKWTVVVTHASCRRNNCRYQNVCWPLLTCSKP